MGWLELLALMKRVLPLLSRVAPMLETYIAARGATKGDSEALERLSGDLRSHLATANGNQSALRETLAAQDERLQQLTDELRQLRSTETAHNVRFDRLEEQIASGTRLVRIALVLTTVLLLACIGLLAVLLLRHR